MSCRAGTVYGDVLDGETQDDGPDHSQGHLGVPVHDFCARPEGRESRQLVKTHNPPLISIF